VDLSELTRTRSWRTPSTERTVERSAGPLSPKMLVAEAGIVPVGVGKSMIAQALGHAACRRGYTVVFTKTSRLLADLAGGHADRTFEARLARWSRPQIIVFDDFAMRDFTLAQADDLYELVTARVAKSSIFTANRQASDWYTLFPNPVVSESILDRIVNSAHHVHMDGKSYRPNKRPGQTPNGTGK
jgi:DNA replication protein DnaC